MTAPFAPQFPVDEVRVGHIRAGSDSSWHACTITADARLGIGGQVPYRAGDPNFGDVAEWFRKQELPTSLLFSDHRGQVLFHHVRWAGTQGSDYQLGTFRAAEVVLGTPRSFPDDYRYRELRSRIDGLDEVVRARTIEVDHAKEATVVRIVSAPSTSWDHGGFSYEISSITPWEHTSGESFTALTHAALTTSRDGGASGADHLSAQWPVRALLLLLHGRALAWRSHEIRDHQFPFWMMSGEELEPTWAPIQLERTNRYLHLPLPADREVGLPLLHLQQFGAVGMQRWLQLYDDDAFARAIDPGVEVLNGASSFMEIRLLMTALGLDAMGFFHDPARNPRQRIARQIQRCVTFSGLDWSDIGSPTAIGLFLADVNNELKHPDRDNRPDGRRLYLADRLAITLFRSQVAPLLQLDKESGGTFAFQNLLSNCLRDFQRNDARLDETVNLRPRG
jgi:hypothetical protein